MENKNLYDILPILLRDPEIVTDEDVSKINEYYNACGRDAVYEFADKEKALPFVSQMLSRIGIDKSFWTETFDGFMKRSARIVELLNEVFTTVKDEGVTSLCVVENFGSVLCSNIPVGCFGSDDVDLTADASEKELLIKALNKAGFHIAVRGHHASDSKELTTVVNENGLAEGDEYWLNIMWLPISRPTLIIQDKYAARMSVERHRAVLYNNTNIRILRPEAMLYFCALHISCGHFYTVEPGMRLYCDIDRIARYRKIDYGELFKWVKEDEIGYRFDLVLEISKHFLHTEFDGVVLPRFKGRELNKYTSLKNFVVNFDTDRFIPAYGKKNRMLVELKSDDTSMLSAIVKRVLHSKLV